MDTQINEQSRWQGHPKELAPGELEAQFDNIREIQFQVALRCGGMNREWIARQMDRDLPEGQQWVGWGFVVNHKCLFVPHDDAMHDPNDTAFIDALATEALGYAPDSLEHLKARRAEAREHIERLRKQIKDLQSQHDGWMETEADLIGRVGVLEREQS